MIESEPNNTIALANILALSTPVFGKIATSSDLDYYKISVASSGILSLTIDVPTNSTSDYYKFGLYDNTGSLLATLATGKDSTFQTPISIAGDYYVGVAPGESYSYNNIAANQYSLTIASMPGATSGYETESNNTVATATALALTTPVIGQLVSSSDLDYYKVSVANSGILSLTIDVPTNSTSDYYKFGLYDNTGSLLATLATGKDSTFQTPVLIAGDYCVGVAPSELYSYDNIAANQYSLTVTSTPGTTSGYETKSNNTITTATALALATPVIGQIISSSDLDYYKVSVTSSGILSLTIDVPTNSTSDYYKIGLYDNIGSLLATLATGKDSTFQTPVLIAGDYYVGVAPSELYSYDNIAANQYSLTVTSTPGTTSGYETESNNTITTATALALATPVIGQIVSSSDLDYYKVSVTNSGILSLTIDVPTNSTSDYYKIGLYDNTGSLVATLASGKDGTFQTTVPTAGDYYVSVGPGKYYSYDNIAANQYSLTVTSTPDSTSGYETESNNTIATATALALTTPVIGQLVSSSDLDYYKISVASSGILSLTIDVPTNITSDYYKIGLYDNAGSLVATFATGEDGTFQTPVSIAGDYYVGVGPGKYYSYDNIAANQYALTVTSTPGSTSGYETESNNTIASATALALSAPVIGQLVSSSDLDYYKVSVASSGILSLTIDVPTNSTSDSYKIGLYDNTGSLVATFATGEDGTFQTPVSIAGDYYVSVGPSKYYSYDNFAANQYSLTIASTSGSTSGYETEFNNTIASATALALSEPVIGQIVSSSDPDYYKVSVASSGLLNLTIDVPTDSTSDYYKFGLYNSTGSLLATLASGKDGTFQTTVPTAGDYYVSVGPGKYYSYDNFAANQYSLTIACTSGSTSGYETEFNNTIASATALALSEPVIGQLVSSSDLDYYKISVASSGLLNLTIDVPTDSTSDYYKFGLYNSTGSLLATLVSGKDSTFQTSVLTADDYYVSVGPGKYYSDDNFAANQYSLTVTSTPGSTRGYETEFNNTIASATALALSAPVIGQLVSSSDLDYYKVSVASSGLLNLTIDVPTDSTSDYYKFGLYNSTGSLLATLATGKDGTFQTPVPTSGDYYVRVGPGEYYGNNNIAANQYSLTIASTSGSTSGYESESNNSMATATALALTTPVIGQLVSSSDLDYYKVSVTSSGLLNVTIDVPTDSTSNYYKFALYNSTGSLLTTLATGKDSTFQTPVPTAGDYYLSVRPGDYFSSNSLVVNQYNLIVVNRPNSLPTGAVTITGTSMQGQTLTAVQSLVDPDGMGIITYQWQADGSNITGATGATLVLGQAQVGKPISAQAHYTDAQGTTESVASSATTNVVNVNDAPTGTVTITGTPAQGQTLTATNSLADIDGIPTTGTGTIHYQWQADGSDISGATSATLVLGQAQVGKPISAQAHYTDAQGTTESVASSATTNVVNVNDAPTGTVTITGTPTQGQMLMATNSLADIDGIPTTGTGAIHYQWQADGSDISGATSATLVLGKAQVGKPISAQAHYTDAQGTTESVASSATTNVVNVNDAPTGTVTITGTPTQGQMLTATNSLADIDGIPTTGTGTIHYQWQADGSDISGATSATLVLGQAQVGKPISAQAHYTDAQGTTESVASSATTNVVNVNDAPTGTVTITGTPTQGQMLTATNTLADVDGLGTIHYQWLADSAPIGGATTNTLELTQAEGGKNISVTASYTDGYSTAESVSSQAILVTAGKTVDLLAYTWKAHTLLDGISIHSGSQNVTTNTNGTASLTDNIDTSLSLTASRAISTTEAAATNSAVNLQDAIAILKMIVGLDVNGAGKPLSPYQALAADFDSNGTVGLTDAIGVLKHVVGLTAPDLVWHFVNEADTSIPNKTNLNPGVLSNAINASLGNGSPAHIGLVGYLSGDVDGSYAGAVGALDLDVMQTQYFQNLTTATGLSLSQFAM